MSDQSVIILQESFLQSVAKDAVSTLACLGIVGVGIWAGSEAMQWVGALTFFGWIFGRSRSYRAFSIEEARRHLDEIERGAE